MNRDQQRGLDARLDARGYPHGDPRSRSDWVEGEVSYADLPRELQQQSDWTYGNVRTRLYAFDLKDTWWDEKDDKDFNALGGFARGNAWERVPKNPEWTANPWRKLHTAQFWCWSRLQGGCS